LIPAIGYAALAGGAVGVQQLLAATYDSTNTLGPMVTAAFIGGPALVLLGEFALFGGGERVAKMMGGQPADDRLTELCSRVATRAGLRPPAHVYEIPTSELNAFAAGFGSGDATVAVTSGLRQKLSTDELEAVIAHEIGHIRHSDMTTNMHAAVAIAGLGGLYELGRFLMRVDSGRESSSDDESSDAASVALMLMVGGAITRVLAHLLQLGISRNAEFDADRVAAELCGAKPMISALSKIERGAATAPRDQLAARGNAFAHAYISNGPSGETPKAAGGWKGAWQKFTRLWSTHPSTEERIAALERVEALAKESGKR